MMQANNGEKIGLYMCAPPTHPSAHDAHTFHESLNANVRPGAADWSLTSTHAPASHTFHESFDTNVRPGDADWSFTFPHAPASRAIHKVSDIRITGNTTLPYISPLFNLFRPSLECCYGVPQTLVNSSTPSYESGNKHWEECFRCPDIRAQGSAFVKRGRYT